MSNHIIDKLHCYLQKMRDYGKYLFMMRFSKKFLESVFENELYLDSDRKDNHGHNESREHSFPIILSL